MTKKSKRSKQTKQPFPSRPAESNRDQTENANRNSKPTANLGFRWWWLALFLIAVIGAYWAWPRPRIIVPKPTSFEGVDAEISHHLTGLISVCQKRNAYDESYLSLAKSYQANGFANLAIDTYTQFLQKNPKHAEGWFWRGICAERIGQLDVAAESMQKCIALDAPYPPCYWRLALWKIEDGQAAVALELLQACDQLTTGDHAARLIRAKAHLELDQPELALQALEDFDFSKTPNLAYANFLRATAWQRLGKTEKSRQFLLAAPPMPVFRDPWSEDVERFAIGMPARRIQATNLFRVGNYSAARKLLETIVNQPQADSRDWSMLGAILIFEKQPARANDCYRKAISFTPSDPWLYFHLARSCVKGIEMGDSNMVAAGHEAIRSALRINPDVSEFHEMLGQLFEASQKREEALGAYEQACALAPRIGTCHWKRIFLLIDLRRWDLARTGLDAIAKAGPMSSEYQLAKAALETATGNEQAASKALEAIPARAFEFDEKMQRRHEALQSDLKK